MRVFVSYKRNDLDGIAKRLCEAFTEWYTEIGDEIFVDVDTIPGAEDWKEYLDASLASADAMIALIGSKWEASPYVRKEIGTALSLGIPVLPVLVGRSRLPGMGTVPTTLRPLFRRQAIRLNVHKPSDEKLLQLWTTIERIVFGFTSDNVVWLRWLLSERPAKGRNVASVRALVSPRGRYRRLHRLSFNSIEAALEELYEAGFVSYTEDDAYYYYWYEPPGT